MKRFLLRYTLALGVLFLFSTRFVDVTVGSGCGRHPAEIAWGATGLAAERFVLDYWVEAKEDGGDLRRLAEQVGKDLRLKETAVFAGQAQDVRFANLDGRLPDGGELVFTVQSADGRRRMGLSCAYNRFPADLLLLVRKIRAALARFGPVGEWAWTVRGHGRGRMEEGAWRIMWNRVLAAMAAVRRDTGEDGRLITAYSPLLPLPAGATGNLVLSLTYDERAAWAVTISHPGPVEGF
ncbi:MAG: hypothetical protein ACUVRM_05300 [Bacillota bacterium]